MTNSNMELSSYVAGEHTVSPDEDPGQEWTSEIETDDGTIEITTEVGSTFEAWTLAYQEMAALNEFFDGDLLDGASDEDIGDTSNWRPFDEEFVEHIRRIILGHVDQATPFDTIDDMPMESIMKIYNRIITHAVARVGNGIDG